MQFLKCCLWIRIPRDTIRPKRSTMRLLRLQLVKSVRFCLHGKRLEDTGANLNYVVFQSHDFSPVNATYFLIQSHIMKPSCAGWFFCFDLWIRFQYFPGVWYMHALYRKLLLYAYISCEGPLRCQPRKTSKCRKEFLLRPSKCCPGPSLWAILGQVIVSY